MRAPSGFSLGIGLAIIVMIASIVRAEIPIDGYLPMVGIALTDEFDEDFNFFPFPSTSPSGTLLGPNGMPNYDLALLDTGAGFSAITSQAYDDFNLDGPYPGESDGFFGTEVITIGGATGQTQVRINDPFGLYAGGLQGASTNGNALMMSHGGLSGQTNTSTITFAEDSALPNILGLPFAGQYATRIRNEAPQVFELDGRTVRTPAIDFLPLGSGGNGIPRKAPLILNPGAAFAQPPTYLPNIGNFDIDNPEENPTTPTLTQGALFLNTMVSNDGSSLGNKEFFFDTGASVTVVSEFNALLLGFDVTQDEPEFTISVEGSGGALSDVPGFFVDQITLPALGGNVTASNVPVVVLDVTNPADPGNIVEGIVGTNLLSGRNIVIDPNPSTGGGGASAGLYISDPVTTEFNWTSTDASASWTTPGAWDQLSTPDLLAITHLSSQTTAPQEAVVSGDDKAWSVSVEGQAAAPMSVRITSGNTLTVFSGTSLQAHSELQLEGGMLDSQYLEVRGGALRGDGHIRTGSGPIAGQVEVLDGILAPAGQLSIDGRVVLHSEADSLFEIGGPQPGTQFDQLQIDGSIAIAGTLNVSLMNGYMPTVGDSFHLLNYDSHAGVFDALALPEEYGWEVTYLEDRFVLEVTSINLTPGDANGDGEVDLADLNILGINWFSTTATFATGDFNGDGHVDLADLNLLGVHWTGPVINSAVPEPAAIILTLLVGVSIYAAPRIGLREL